MTAIIKNADLGLRPNGFFCRINEQATKFERSGRENCCWAGNVPPKTLVLLAKY